MAFASYSGLLVILLALECCTANGYEGNIGIKRETELDKSLQDAFDGANANGKRFLEGRKMLQGLESKPLSISGKNKPADLDHKSLQEQQLESICVDTQSNVEMLNQKGDHKSEGPHEATPTTSSGNRHVFTEHEHYSSEKNDEPKSFLDAADEVANLMSKDYKGGDRPRRKPPINNHEPKN